MPKDPTPIDTRGKGGNFAKTKNPFQNINPAQAARPALDDCGDLPKVAERVIAAGCAIMLGATRDGGAVVITIFDGDTRHKTYCSDDLELDRAMAALIDVYEP